MCDVALTGYRQLKQHLIKEKPSDDEGFYALQIGLLRFF